MTMDSYSEGLAPSRIEAERDAWEERQIADERESRLATPGEAHAEWHLNAGVPMGQPGCPQDACHLPDDLEPEPGPGEGIRCAHCKGRHWDVAEVKACAARQAADKTRAAERAVDSQWSWDYQNRWGRAENE
jgi:hypothetical protein